MVAPLVGAGMAAFGPQLLQTGQDILSNIPVIGGLFESSSSKAQKRHEAEMRRVAQMYQQMAPGMYQARMNNMSNASHAFAPVMAMMVQKYGPGAVADFSKMLQPGLTPETMDSFGGQPQKSGGSSDAFRHQNLNNTRQQYIDNPTTPLPTQLYRDNIVANGRKSPTGNQGMRR